MEWCAWGLRRENRRGGLRYAFRSAMAPASWSASFASPMDRNCSASSGRDFGNTPTPLSAARARWVSIDRCSSAAAELSPAAESSSLRRSALARPLARVRCRRQRQPAVPFDA